MTLKEAKKRAWEDWHGDMQIDDIPRITPSFDQGFDSAWMMMAEELRPILAIMDGAYPRTLSGVQALDRVREKLRGLIDQ